jgi:FkbM family methyltransferase
MAGHEVTLPNGMIVSCLQKHEVPLVNLEIESYFTNGVRLAPGDTVFDVGANIGLFSLAAYARCSKNLRIYAFEPVPAIYDLLCANLERNAPAGQIEALPLGLSNRAGTLRFAYYPRAPVLSTAYPDEAVDIEIIKGTVQNSIMYLDEAPRALRWLSRVPAFLRGPILGLALKRTLRPTAVTCRMKTLSQFLRERRVDRVDFLKIDAEKAELDVLQGIDDEDWRKIRQMVVEVHDLDGRLETVTGLLRRRGYEEVTVDQPPTNATSNIYTVFALRQ